MLVEEKKALRALIRARLKTEGPDAILEASRRAAAGLSRFEPFLAAELLLAFLSMPGEVDTEPLVGAALAGGRRVAVPRIEGGEISFVPLAPDYLSWPRDRFGIPEPPAGLASLDLAEIATSCGMILVPGLAFDPAGRRLGRGKGYYDRFLARLEAAEALLPGRPVAPRVGLALELQVVAAVPAEEHDRRVDWLATETGIRRTDRSHGL